MVDNGNSYYKYVADDGIIQADTSQILADVQTEWINRFGTSISVNPTTPQGRIIEIETVERKSTVELCASVANQFNPNYATGQFLDAWGAIFNIYRKRATNTIVYLTATGVYNTVVPANSQVSDNNNNLYSNPNEFFIPVSGTISGVPFVALKKGNISPEQNTVSKIVTPVIGWETVNNPFATVDFGEDQESDYDLRYRIAKSRFSGISVIDDIVSALYRLDNMISCFVYNNPTNQNVFVRPGSSQVALPHSVFVVVYGGGSNYDIANALYRTVSAGCNYSPAESGSVVYNYPVKINGATIVYNITFNRAITVPFYSQIKVKSNKYIGNAQDLAKQIKKSVVDWSTQGVGGVDRLNVGASVSPFEIGSAISESIPDIAIQDVQIGITSGTYSHNVIDMDVNEVGVTGEAYITVFVDGVEITVE